MLKRLATLLGVAAVVLGCGEPTPELAAGQRADQAAWSDDGAPSLLADAVERRHALLPEAGAVDGGLWSGGHWPAWRDGINHRWAGPEALSPGEKYGRAFSVANLPDALSAMAGVDALGDAKACSTDADCDGGRGERCGLRRVATTGRCVAGWRGLGVGRAAAAILSPAPLAAVEHQGMMFRPIDLQALLILLHSEGLQRRVLGLRCDDPAGSTAACADVNAGAFHVVVTNLLGLQGRALVAERASDDAEWHAVVAGYEILRDVGLDVASAHRLLGIEASGAPYRPDPEARALRHLRMQLNGLGDTPSQVLEYVLELDARGVVTGGAWIGASRAAHPDQLWIPEAATAAEVARRRVPLAEQRGRVARGGWAAVGRYAVAPGERVHAQLTGDGDADLYLRFDARPWVDAWDCASKGPGSLERCVVEAPAGVREAVVYVRGEAATSTWTAAISVERNGTGVRAAEVRALLERSRAAATTAPEPVLTDRAGTVEAKGWRHFGPYTVGTGALEATLETLGGDADLYVGVGDRPTATSFDCRSWRPGLTAEACVVAGDAVYVSVYGRRASDFVLQVGYTPSDEAPSEAVTLRQVKHVDVVPKGDWVHLGPFAVSEGALDAELEVASGDADLHVRVGARPTAEAWDCRPALSGSAVEACAVSGRQVFVSVYGQERAEFAVTLRYRGR